MTAISLEGPNKIRRGERFDFAVAEKPQIENAQLTTLVRELLQKEVPAQSIQDEIVDYLSFFANSVDSPEKNAKIIVASRYQIGDKLRIIFDRMMSKYPRFTGEQIAFALSSRSQEVLGLPTALELSQQEATR